MGVHRRFACAALLLACLPGLAGASEGAGLFSADDGAIPLRQAPKRLLREDSFLQGKWRGESANGVEELRERGLALGWAASSAALRSRVAEVDLGQLESARLGVEGRHPARLHLNLFVDAAFDAVLERSAPTASGYTLTGQLADDPMSAVALAVNGGWVAGTIWSPHGRYAVRPLGGGVAEVRQSDPSSLRRCGVGAESMGGPAGSSSPEAGRAFANRAVASKPAALSETFPEDDGSEIDVLVVYPSFARRSAGGHLAMRALIDGDVALTNEMYRSSGAVQRINLVGAVELRRRPEVEGSRNMLDQLDRLLDGNDGYMDEVHGLRDAYAADMVLMHWGHLGGVGRGLTIGFLAGVALQMEDLSGNYAPNAFSVANSWAFAHELGHGMGLLHDRYNDVGNRPFPYSHGYAVPDNSPGLPPEREGRGMTTVMVASSNEYLAVPRFSNPNLRYPDESGPALGVPGDAPSDSVDGPADAVRSLNGTRRVVANFRPSASRCRYGLSPPPGPLPASGGEFRIGVEAGEGCAWSAFSNEDEDFVSVVEGSSGEGDGEVVFRVSANAGWERDMAVFVAGEAYLAEQATARQRRAPPLVCERTPAVRDAITAAAGKEACGEVAPSDLASIRILNLRWAISRDLPVGSLDGLTGLVSLDLGRNHDYLTALEPGLFDGLLKLRELILDGNHLTALRAGAFDGVPNLARLELWNNRKLATLEPGAFRGLSNVEELNLSGTGLTTLSAGTFEGLPSLRSLRFGVAFDGDDCGRVDGVCIHVFVPLARVEPGAFRGPSALHTLVLDGSSLTTLRPGLFDELSKLRTLRLRYNRSLTTLEPSLFDGLAELNELNLSANQLKTLEPGVFGRLSKLRYLHLNDNSLTALEPGLFDGLAELDGLVLSANQLKTLEPGAFRGLVALGQLILDENQLQSLEPGVFDGLPGLWWLRLSDNELAALHPNLFRGLGGLRQLELDGNQLTTLHPELFRGLGSLWYADLARNRLKTVPAGLFDEQRSRIDTIKLGGNRLANLDPGLFRGMARMNSLQLSGNELAALPPFLFNGLRGLLRMDLSGNPGAPFAFRPEIVRVEGASDAGRTLGVALELPQGAAFDLHVGLSASGGALSVNDALVQVGRDRSEAVSVTPNGDGPVIVRIVAVSDVPGPPCEEIFYPGAAYDHCLIGVRTALGAPLVLHGLPDQTLAQSGAVRFDLPSAFPSFPAGMTYAVELGNPAVAEATVREGLLILSAADGGETEVAVTATAPDGRRETRRFTVTVEQTLGSLWGGWRSTLLRPPPAEEGDGG